MCRGFAELGGRLGEHPEVELGAIRRDVDLDFVATAKLGGENLLRQRVLDKALDGSLQRPCTEVFVVALLREEITRRSGELERELLLHQPLLHVLEQDPNNLPNVILR